MEGFHGDIKGWRGFGIYGFGVLGVQGAGF